MTRPSATMTPPRNDELVRPFELSHTEVVDEAVATRAMPSQYALVQDGSGHPVEPHRLFKQILRKRRIGLFAVPRTAARRTQARHY